MTDQEHASWVRQRIAVGIKAADEGQVISHEAVRKMFLPGLKRGDRVESGHDRGDGAPPS